MYGERDSNTNFLEFDGIRWEYLNTFGIRGFRAQIPWNSLARFCVWNSGGWNLISLMSQVVQILEFDFHDVTGCPNSGIRSNLAFFMLTEFQNGI